MTSSRLCGFVMWVRNSAVSWESLFPDGFMVSMLIRSPCLVFHEVEISCKNDDVCVVWWNFAANLLMGEGAFGFFVMA